MQKRKAIPRVSAYRTIPYPILVTLKPCNAAPIKLLPMYTLLNGFLLMENVPQLVAGQLEALIALHCTGKPSVRIC